MVAWDGSCGRGRRRRRPARDDRRRPWRLGFDGPSGQASLEEYAGTGIGPGRDARLPHAGRLVSRHAGDGGAPRGGRLRRDARRRPTRRPHAERARRSRRRRRPRGRCVGAGRLDAGRRSRTGISFVAPPGERHLGFGERSNAVDQRGLEVENYVAEGPYQLVERPFIAGFVPPPGYHPRDDATYFPIPWLLSTRGIGVLVTNDETSVFRLGNDQPDAWSVRGGRAEDRPARRRRARAGRRRAPLQRARRPPAAGRGAVLLRSLVAAAERHRRSEQHRDAEGGGRDRLGGPDLHALPAVRRPGRGERARADRALPRRRPRRHHLLQPDGLHASTRAATRRRGSAAC